MSPLAVVGYAAVAALVVGWLAVSFSAPGPRRETLEWLSATALYVALLCLFVNLGLRARAADSTAAFYAFVFLCLFFGGGLLVSAYNAVRSLRGPPKIQTSATN